jgi:tetratricopeptide (TPR) repeat protein/glycosyltransferase involved in cell wall biosynthesis
MQARVSLSLIVKNEEANLPACLQSVAGLVDEVVVVDTGSTDRTREVAAGLGARVFDFAWCDSFSAARNESLRRCTGDWVFWLDGDERLDEANRAKFQALRSGLNGQAVAFVMKQCSASYANGSSPTEVDQVRLFRRHPAIQWSYRVHEQILPAVRRAGHAVRFTDIAIAHTGYQDPALQRRKTERNLRLLHLEYGEQPDDPFTLFNLGWGLHELGQPDKAIPLLRRSLERCGPGDSIVRKLFVLLSHAHRRLGQMREALAVCRAGRARCPDDAELLFVEGVLLLETGDPAGAEVCLRQLLAIRPGAHFASLDAGLRGGKARHHLALACRGQGRLAEAEEHWRAVVAEQPSFTPSWLGLGEIYLAQGRWAEFDAALARVPAEPDWEAETLLLRGRACLARGEFRAARKVLEDAAARAPGAVGPRVLLTHALLQEGADPAAAERALRDVLSLDPRLAECWRNLAVLLRQQGRLAEAVAVCRSGLGQCAGDAPLLLQHGLFLAESGENQEAETCLLRYLESQPARGDEAVRSRRCSAHHQLALLCLRQRRTGEAEAHWRAVRAEHPDHLGALLGLAELCLAEQRDGELDELLAELTARPDGELEAAVFQARRHLGRREFGEARRLLEETTARHPNAVWPWAIWSQVLIQEGQDLAEAERILRRVLDLDPHHAEARNNLALLRPRLSEDLPTLEDSTRTPAPGPFTPGQRLRVAFVCFNRLPYHLDTPRRVPLGGSESAVCYLAEALAQAGHEVFLLHPCSAPERSRGVQCLPLPASGMPPLPALDALVVLNLAGRGRDLRRRLAPGTCLIYWTGHALDQPAMMPLRDPAERDAYDGFAFVSDWQRRQYVHYFGIDPEKSGVLRNGISPAFQDLFAEGASILAAKSRPPVLAYTSTPYRGLDLLLEAFPAIRRAVPGVILKVFSGMGVYQVPEAEDRSRFGWLYQRCRQTDGVEYLGSHPQEELAVALRSASVLAYPNSYPETSCIAVLEALAAGCLVVTSRRGALAETTAGFARLVPADDDRPAYVEQFAAATVQALADWTGAEDSVVESKLAAQVAHVRRAHTWPVLVEEWAGWLTRVRLGKG